MRVTTVALELSSTSKLRLRPNNVRRTLHRYGASSYVVVVQSSILLLKSILQETINDVACWTIRPPLHQNDIK